VLDINIAERH